MSWNPFKDVEKAVRKTYKKVIEPVVEPIIDIGKGGKRTEKAVGGAKRFVRPGMKEAKEDNTQRIYQRQYDQLYKRRTAQKFADINLLHASSDQDLMNQAEREFAQSPEMLEDESFVNSLLSAYSTRGAELKSGRTQRKSSLGGGAQAGYCLLYTSDAADE